MICVVLWFQVFLADRESELGTKIKKRLCSSLSNFDFRIQKNNIYYFVLLLSSRCYKDYMIQMFDLTNFISLKLILEVPVV